MKFDPNSGIQFSVNIPWIEHFNIFYFLGVDGLSMPMVILTALLSISCSAKLIEYSIVSPKVLNSPDKGAKTPTFRIFVLLF